MHHLLLLVVSIWLAIAGNNLTVQHPANFPNLPHAQQSLRRVDPPTGFSVWFHPDGGLFVGDRVSFEVFYIPDASNGKPLDLDHHKVEVRVAGPGGAKLGSAEFGPGPNPGQFRASLQWVWDTTGLQPDEYTLSFELPQDGIRWDQAVTLGPRDAVPPPEPESRWAKVDTDCCVIHYLTHTAAERDLDLLISIADQEAQIVSRAFGKKIDEPFRITFLPRVLGHGGFASNDIYVSYLDRNYAGSTVQQVLRHEMVHFVDAKLGGELRPEMLVEGLATYLTGGHFKPDPFIADAAALVQAGWYIPLRTLADSFYPSQHEIGYLESAGLIEYMVNTWGWEAFSAFYRDIHPQDSKSQADAIDAALQEHFGLTFAQVEDRFLNFLQGQAVIPDIRTDIFTSVRFYDTVRRYQKAMDPSANFRQVWLPNSDEMRKRGIVADYLRHPESTDHYALETLLLDAEMDLRSGRFDQANRSLSAIQAVLIAIDIGKPDPFSVDPLAEQQRLIASTIERCGLEPQKIDLNSTYGQAEVIGDWPALEKIPLRQMNGEWQLDFACSTLVLQQNP